MDLALKWHFLYVELFPEPLFSFADTTITVVAVSFRQF